MIELAAMVVLIYARWSSFGPADSHPLGQVVWQTSCNRWTTMPATRSAIVIGSGFGGLALAIRLQSAGIATTIVEARDRPGGRAYVWKRDGYTFDAGPTVITESGLPGRTVGPVRQPYGGRRDAAAGPSVLSPAVERWHGV